MVLKPCVPTQLYSEHSSYDKATLSHSWHFHKSYECQPHFNFTEKITSSTPHVSMFFLPGGSLKAGIITCLFWDMEDGFRFLTTEICDLHEHYFFEMATCNLAGQNNCSGITGWLSTQAIHFIQDYQIHETTKTVIT